METIRRIGALAVLAVAAVAIGGDHAGVGADPSPDRDARLAANRCILCSSYGASNAPRICNSCNGRFNNRCILCNGYGASNAPRICNSCNGRFNNRCILCNSYGASMLPRICNSCNNKY